MTHWKRCNAGTSSGQLKNAGAMEKVASRYDLSGFLGIFPYSCRPFASDALVLKDAVKKGTDIPVTIQEGDCWDARKYSAGVLRTRLESFAEICKIANVSS